jgi:hypothetical protein
MSLYLKRDTLFVLDKSLSVRGMSLYLKRDTLFVLDKSLRVRGMSLYLKDYMLSYLGQVFASRRNVSVSN